MKRKHTRKPYTQVRSWESYPKSVSFKVETIEAIEKVMEKTGKTFSAIVEDCCYQVVLKDTEYFRLLARKAAMDMAKWQHMQKVSEAINEVD